MSMIKIRRERIEEVKTPLADDHAENNRYALSHKDATPVTCDFLEYPTSPSYYV